MSDPESPPTATVSPEELATALAVWIKTGPKRMWLDYWHHSETAGKWSAGSDPARRFDPRVALADYLVGKFAQAKWQVTYSEPRGHGDLPPRRAPLAGGEDTG